VTPESRSIIRHRAVPAVAAAVVAVVIYAVTLAGTYVYDDVAVVRDDPRVRQVDQWSKLFARGYFDPGVDNLYRPVVSFSYALQWFVHGDRPWAFHAVNILLNAAVAAAVAEFTRRLRNGRAGSIQGGLVAGILFAVHPIHVEAVANIVGRAELASALCVMSALVILVGALNRKPRLARRENTPGGPGVCGDPPACLHAGLNRPVGDRRSPVSRKVAMALGIAVIGLFCKEQAVLQPLIWIIGWFCLCRGGGKPVKLFALFTCWIWAIYLVVREHFFKFEWDRSFLDWSVQPMILSNGIDRILMPVVLVGHYMALLVWPAHLSPDYGGDVIGSIVRRGDPYLWIGFGAIAVWLAAAVTAAVRRAWPALFCLLSFAVVYGMVGNVVAIIGTNMAERLMYLPTAFLFTAVGLSVTKFDWRPVCAVVTPIVVLLSVQTVRYAQQWNHPAELFATALETHPGSIQLYLLLSQSDRDAGRYDLAETVLARACARHPAYYRVWVLRAENAMDLGDWPAAHRWLAVALKKDGNHQQIAAAMGELEKREPKKK
jgi:hypothetical protein